MKMSSASWISSGMGFASYHLPATKGHNYSISLEGVYSNIIRVLPD